MADIIDQVKKVPLLKRRQRLAMGLLGAVILCSGFVLGASTTFFFLRERIRPVPPPFRPPSDRLLRDLTQDLQLSEEQQAQVKDLLGDQYRKWDQERRYMGEKMRQHFEELVASMKGILTPGQFKRWEEETKRRMERRRGRWGDRDRGRRPGGDPGRAGRGGRDGPPWRNGDHSPRRGPEPNQAKPLTPPGEPNGDV